MSARFRHKLRLLPLIAFLYASLSGGPFGQEAMLPSSGPGMVLLLLVVAAFLWGVPMMLTAAELGSAMPVEGGYYRWTRRALGDFWGFQSGWWIWFSSLLDQAIYPVLMVSYLEKFLLPGISDQVITVGFLQFRWLHWLLCMTVIIPCTAINIRGVKAVGLTSIVLDVLIIVPYLIFVIVAFSQWQFNPFTPLVPPGKSVPEALGFGLLFAMWNYSGFQLPSTASEEIDNPTVALPKASFIALPLIMLGYILPLMAALAVRSDWMTWEDGTFVHIAREIGEIVPHGGAVLAALVTLGTVAGCVSLFNGLLVPYTRIQFAMAEDRFQPGWLTRLHPRYETPWKSILFNVAIYSILIMFDFQELLTVDIWLLLPPYCLVFLSLAVLRWREPRLRRPFRIRGGALGLSLVILPPILLAGAAAWSSVRQVLEANNYFVLWVGVGSIASGPAAYLAAWSWHRLHGTRPLPALRAEDASEPAGADAPQPPA
ncbi:MAG: APC family permease [Acidobacteriota bacterium]